MQPHKLVGEAEDKGQKPHHYAPQLVQPFGLRRNLGTSIPKTGKMSMFQQAGSPSLFTRLIFSSPGFQGRNHSLK